MSVGFRAVQWNHAKLVYDGILIVAVAAYIAGFAAIYHELRSEKEGLASGDLDAVFA